MTTDAKWYEDMAAAMKERDRALTGIARWQEALATAEAKIEELRDGDTGQDSGVDLSFPASFKAAEPRLAQSE